MKVFELAVAGGDGKQRRAGCLLIDTVIGQDHTDPEIARIVGDANEDLEKRLWETIERSQDAGEIAADVDPVQTARVLLSQYRGACARSLRYSPRSVLDAVLQQVEALLSVPLAERAEKP